MTLRTPFAEFEALVNRETFTHLSDSIATFADGSAVAGLFEAPYARADVGFMDAASSRPTFTLPTAALPVGPDWHGFPADEFDAVDLRLSLRGADYLVVGHEPDGTGVSRLLLQKVAA